MPCFWWLMASHEHAPILLPNLWEGGKERSDDAGGKNRERSLEREKKKNTSKDRGRFGRMNGRRKHTLIQGGEERS